MFALPDGRFCFHAIDNKRTTCQSGTAMRRSYSDEEGSFAPGDIAVSMNCDNAKKIVERSDFASDLLHLCVRRSLVGLVFEVRYLQTVVR